MGRPMGGNSLIVAHHVTNRPYTVYMVENVNLVAPLRSSLSNNLLLFTVRFSCVCFQLWLGRLRGLESVKQFHSAILERLF